MSAGAPDGRCPWALSSPDYLAYHDEEWGRPVRDDRGLYERMVLEGFQSGLSWLTILRKRERFRAAFANFDIEAVAGFGERDVERLLADAGIVRHRGKIEAAIANARAAAALRDDGESLAELIWSHAPPRPSARAADARRRAGVTPESTALAKELKRRGFRFVGPHHRLRDDAGLRPRERPPGGLPGPARGRGTILGRRWMNAL